MFIQVYSHKKKQAVWSKVIKLPKNVGFPAQLPLAC
jgi:hypothetical protein